MILQSVHQGNMILIPLFCLIVFIILLCSGSMLPGPVELGLDAMNVAEDRMDDIKQKFPTIQSN